MKKLVFIFLYVFLYLNSYSYLQIYPTVFDKNIDKFGSSEVYEISNPTLDKLRYIFYIDKIKDTKDMSEWVEYYPKMMILNPGEKKELTVFIKAPKNIKRGEYTAILGIKELPLITEEDIIEKNKSLDVLINLKIEIVGFVEDLSLEIETKNINLNRIKKRIEGVVKNIGEKRATFTFYLIDTRSKKEYYLGSRRILSKKYIDLSTFSEIKKVENLKDYNELIIKYQNQIIKRIKI